MGKVASMQGNARKTGGKNLIKEGAVRCRSNSPTEGG